MGSEETFGEYILRLAADGKLPSNDFKVGLVKASSKKRSSRDEIKVSIKHQDGKSAQFVEIMRGGNDISALAPAHIFKYKRKMSGTGKSWKERMGVLGARGAPSKLFKDLEIGRTDFDMRESKFRNDKDSEKQDAQSKSEDIHPSPPPSPGLNNAGDNKKNDNTMDEPLPHASKKSQGRVTDSKMLHNDTVMDGQHEGRGYSEARDRSPSGTNEDSGPPRANNETQDTPKPQEEASGSKSLGSSPLTGTAEKEFRDTNEDASVDDNKFQEIFGVSSKEADLIVEEDSTPRVMKRRKGQTSDAENTFPTEALGGRFSKVVDDSDSMSDEPPPEESESSEGIKILRGSRNKRKSSVSKRPRKGRGKASRVVGGSSSVNENESTGKSHKVGDTEASEPRCSPSTDQTDAEADAATERKATPLEKLARSRDPRKLSQATKFLKPSSVLKMQGGSKEDTALPDVSVIEYLRLLCIIYSGRLQSGIEASESQSGISPSDDEWARSCTDLCKNGEQIPPLLAIQDVATFTALVCSSLHIPNIQSAWYAVEGMKKSVLQFCFAVVACTFENVGRRPNVDEESSKFSISSLFSAAAGCSRIISALIVHESELPFPSDATLMRRSSSRRSTKSNSCFRLQPQGVPSHAYELLTLGNHPLVKFCTDCLVLVLATETHLRRATLIRHDLVTAIEVAVLYKMHWISRDQAFGLTLAFVEEKFIDHEAFYQVLDQYLRPFCKNEPRAVAFVAQLSSREEFLRRLYRLPSPHHRRNILVAVVDRLVAASMDPVRASAKHCEGDATNLQIPKNTLGMMDAIAAILGLAAMQREVIGDPGLRKKYMRALKIFFGKGASAIKDYEQGVSWSEFLEIDLPEEVRNVAIYSAKLLGGIARSMESKGISRTFTLKFLMLDLFGSQRQLETLHQNIKYIRAAVEQGDISEKERALVAMAAFRVEDKLKQGAQRRRQSNDNEQEKGVPKWTSTDALKELAELEDTVEEFEWGLHGQSQLLDSLKNSILRDEDMESDGLIFNMVLDVRDEDLRRYVDHEKVPSTFKRLTRNDYVGDARKLLPRVQAPPACACVPGGPGYMGDAAVGCSNKACTTRSILFECDPGNCGAKETCANRRFQKQEYAPFKVSVASNPKLGFAAKATAAIAKGTLVGEYQGEVVTEEEYERRKMSYHGERHFYFMNLEPGLYIDASRKAQMTRFINHSCDPSARTEKWIVRGEPRIGIFAIRDIAKGEEITFDYQSSRNGSHLKSVRCLCGTAKCRGFLVGGKDEEKKDRTEDIEKNDHQNENKVEDSGPAEVKQELHEKQHEEGHEEQVAEEKIGKIKSIMSQAKERLEQLKSKNEDSTTSISSKTIKLRLTEWEKRLENLGDPETRRLIALEAQQKELNKEISNVPSIPRRSPTESEQGLPQRSPEQNDVGIPRKRGAEEAEASKGGPNPSKSVEPDRKRIHTRTVGSSDRTEVGNDIHRQEWHSSNKSQALGRSRSRFLRMDYNSKNRREKDRENESDNESDCYSICPSPAPVYDEQYDSPPRLNGHRAVMEEERPVGSPVISGHDWRRRTELAPNGIARDHEYARGRRLSQNESPGLGSKRYEDSRHNRDQRDFGRRPSHYGTRHPSRRTDEFHHRRR